MKYEYYQEVERTCTPFNNEQNTIELNSISRLWDIHVISSAVRSAGIFIWAAINDYWSPLIQRKEVRCENDTEIRIALLIIYSSCISNVTIYLLFLSKCLLSYLIFGAYSYLIFRSTTPRSLHIATQSHSVDVYFILGYRVSALFIF